MMVITLVLPLYQLVLLVVLQQSTKSTIITKTGLSQFHNNNKTRRRKKSSPHLALSVLHPHPPPHTQTTKLLSHMSFCTVCSAFCNKEQVNLGQSRPVNQNDRPGASGISVKFNSLTNIVLALQLSPSTHRDKLRVQ